MRAETAEIIMTLLFQGLTYQIRGACYDVFKDYGGKHKEVLYQRALAEKLTLRGLTFEREKRLSVISKDSGITLGFYQPDFLIADTVILELKALDFIPKSAKMQVLDYLRNTQYKVALLANFSPEKCDVIRIINTTGKR
jgi:GxxExxY protein